MQRPLVPAFLKKWEERLLLRRPEVWSARAHIVLWYGLVFMAVLALISYLVPDDPREETLSPIWVGFISIVSILALVVWLIYLLRFNVFKRYGRSKPAAALVTFLLYFVSVATIILFTCVQPKIESIRANKAYGNDEIVRDINAINISVCQLEYDSLQHEWQPDTMQIIPDRTPTKSTYTASDEPTAIDSAVATSEKQHREYTHQVIEISELPQRLKVDSAVKLNDSIYIFYSCPKYTFLNVTNSDRYATEKELNDKDVFNRVIRHYTAPDRSTVTKELMALVAKYDPDKTTDHEMVYPNQDYTSKIEHRYDLYTVSQNMSHITERKYRWQWEEIRWLPYLLYYITLCVTLLIFIFRHSTTRTFFLSLLTAIIIVLLTALCMAFTGANSGSDVMGIIFIYYMLFFFVSVSVWNRRTRSAVTGIATSMFVFMTPFIPLVMVGYHYATLSEHRIDYNRPVYDVLKEQRDMWYAQVVGAALLVALLATYIPMLYRKWYALPEE